MFRCWPRFAVNTEKSFKKRFGLWRKSNVDFGVVKVEFTGGEFLRDDFFRIRRQYTEWGLSNEHREHDAAKGPDITRQVVLLLVENFWRHIRLRIARCHEHTNKTMSKRISGAFVTHFHAEAAWQSRSQRDRSSTGRQSRPRTECSKASSRDEQCRFRGDRQLKA